MALQNGIASDVKSSSQLKRMTPWARLHVRTRFRVLDALLGSFVLTPLAVLFQVSASGLQDFFFLSYVPASIGTSILFALGLGLELACSVGQGRLASLSHIRNRNAEDTVKFLVTTRMYHYVIGFANVCHYRALGDVYYALLGNGTYAAVQATATTAILLLSLKCARNVLGPPLSVGVDSSIQDFFVTSTYFRTKGESKKLTYLADNAATVLIVTSLCFAHWISVWALFDQLLFPQNHALSVVVSWLLGYSIVFAALLFEFLWKRISRNLEKSRTSAMPRILFEDTIVLLANVGVILVWRGHWMFFESLAYYFPIYHNDTDISAFYGNFSSFAMLCLLHSTVTLIAKGCDFDGELKGGDGVAFGIDYFAEFFQEQIAEEERVEAADARRLGKEKKQATAFLNNNTLRVSSSPADKREISLGTLVELDSRKTKLA